MSLGSAFSNTLVQAFKEVSPGEWRVQFNQMGSARARPDDAHQFLFRHHITHIKVYVQSGDNPDQKEPKLILEAESFDQETELRLVDVNGDGRHDLMVQTGIGYGGVNVYFDLYLATEDGFSSKPVVEGLSNPEADLDTQQIFSGERSGSQWYNSTYKLHNGQPYRYITTATVADTIEYAQFFAPDGSLKQEMLTVTDNADPEEWQPIRVVLPDDNLFPLRTEPDDDSATMDAIPAGSTVLLRQISDDLYYTLIESVDGKRKGWIKTEWLTLPDGLSFDQ